MDNSFSSTLEWLESVVYSDAKPQVKHAAHSIEFLLRKQMALTLKNIQMVMGYKNRDQARNALKVLASMMVIQVDARNGVGTKITPPPISNLPEKQVAATSNSGSSYMKNGQVLPEKQVPEKQVISDPYKDNITNNLSTESADSISNPTTSSRNTQGGTGGGPTKKDVQHFVDEWNSLAGRTGLACVKGLNETRIRKAKKLLRDHNAATIKTAFRNIEVSSFLCGESDRGWRANFDWLLQPSSFSKLIEGTYGNGRTAQVKCDATMFKDEHWQQALQVYADYSVWNAPGSPPGQIGCEVPQHLLEDA